MEGIDYNEIFSPVVKHCSIRILMTIVNMYDFELERMDDILMASSDMQDL